MKRWTERQAREATALDARDYGAQSQANRESFGTLDRTQIPAQAISKSQVLPYAMHRVWTFGMEDISPTYPGEQEAVRSNYAIQLPYTWEAATYKKFGGSPGGLTFATLSLPGGKEGFYHLDFKANAMLHPYFTMSSRPVNAKHLGIIARLNGVTILETWGAVRGMSSFVLSGVGVGQAGTNVVELAFTFPAAGDNDAVVLDGTSYPWVVAHLWGMQAVVRGTWR